MFTKHFFNALSYHPDRLSQRFASRKALWVAPSASAKKTAYFTTKNIIWRFFFDLFTKYIRTCLLIFTLTFPNPTLIPPSGARGLPTRQLALSLKMFTEHFLNAPSYHPDRLLPASPAARLFGLLRRSLWLNLHFVRSWNKFRMTFSIFYNEKNHMTVFFELFTNYIQNLFFALTFKL